MEVFHICCRFACVCKFNRIDIITSIFYLVLKLHTYHIILFAAGPYPSFHYWHMPLSATTNPLNIRISKLNFATIKIRLLSIKSLVKEMLWRNCKFLCSIYLTTSFSIFSLNKMASFNVNGLVLYFIIILKDISSFSSITPISFFLQSAANKFRHNFHYNLI